MNLAELREKRLSRAMKQALQELSVQPLAKPGIHPATLNALLQRGLVAYGPGNPAYPLHRRWSVTVAGLAALPGERDG